MLSIGTLFATDKKWHPSLCGRPLEGDGTLAGAVFLAAIRVSLWPTTHPGFASFGWFLGASYPLIPSSLCVFNRYYTPYWDRL